VFEQQSRQLRAHGRVFCFQRIYELAPRIAVEIERSIEQRAQAHPLVRTKTRH
jgi:hypothetical protein